MAYLVKDVQLPGYLRLQYVEQGPPSGVPIVFLHGVTDSWHSFEPVLPHLPTEFRAFALTQRGHGDSDRPDGGYNFDQMAADVADFMDAIGLRSAVIVGHSMGSSVAQRFAMDYPDRVRGLVLVGAFASMRDNVGVHDFYTSAIAPLTDPVPTEIAHEFQVSTIARPMAPELLDTFVRESLKVPARVWKATFEGFLVSDLPKEYNKIKAPILILWGDQDAFCPRGDQDVLLAGIPGARLTIYPGTGHAVHWDQPKKFVADLTAFVNGLPRG